MAFDAKENWDQLIDSYIACAVRYSDCGTTRPCRITLHRSRAHFSAFEGLGFRV
jgi:hypothetical protein